MIRNNFLRAATLTAAFLLTVTSARATNIPLNLGDTVNVAEAAVSTWTPAPKVVTIKDPVVGYPNGVNVYAGVNNLKIQTTTSPTLSDEINGFCIDPFHFSSPSYVLDTVVPLANAPKNNAVLDPDLIGGMGAQKAKYIQNLWALYYDSALSDSSGATAAGMQIAIWEIVSEGLTVTGGVPAFSLDDPNVYHAADYVIAAKAYNGSVPNLVALSGGGQDYVVQGVPDAGATLMLAGIALGGVLLFRRKVAA